MGSARYDAITRCDVLVGLFELGPLGSAGRGLLNRRLDVVVELVHPLVNFLVMGDNLLLGGVEFGSLGPDPASHVVELLECQVLALGFGREVFFRQLQPGLGGSAVAVEEVRGDCEDDRERDERRHGDLETLRFVGCGHGWLLPRAKR